MDMKQRGNDEKERNKGNDDHLTRTQGEAYLISMPLGSEIASPECSQGLLPDLHLPRRS